MIVIGVGGYNATNAPGQGVKTFALGSCVAVVLLNPATRAVGMVHVALPSSAISPAKAMENPGYFADTGIPALLRQMTSQYGVMPNSTQLIVKMAGGANVMDPNQTFMIGKRNISAVLEVLARYGLKPVAADVGGEKSRTVSVFVDSGEVLLSSCGRQDWTI